MSKKKSWRIFAGSRKEGGLQVGIEVEEISSEKESLVRKIKESHQNLPIIRPHLENAADHVIIEIHKKLASKFPEIFNPDDFEFFSTYGRQTDITTEDAVEALKKGNISPKTIKMYLFAGKSNKNINFENPQLKPDAMMWINELYKGDT